jgi:excisionase family DNA binding protein
MAKRKAGEWLSVVEVANRLGVTRETVYEAIKTGRLKARLKTVSRKVWRVDPQSLAGFEVSASHQKRGKRGAQRRQSRDN